MSADTPPQSNPHTEDVLYEDAEMAVYIRRDRAIRIENKAGNHNVSVEVDGPSTLFGTHDADMKLISVYGNAAIQCVEHKTPTVSDGEKA